MSSRLHEVYPQAPWWCNDSDDAGCFFRRFRLGTLHLTLKDWMLGVSTERWLNEINYKDHPSYWTRHTTLRFGPLWFVVETFRDVSDA